MSFRGRRSWLVYVLCPWLAGCLREPLPAQGGASESSEDEGEEGEFGEVESTTRGLPDNDDTTATGTTGVPGTTTATPDPSGDPPPVILDLPNPDELVYDLDIQPIWDANCALAGCHADTISPSLVEGRSRDELRSISSQGLRYIEPFASERSYLFLKILGAPGISGARMPPIGRGLSMQDFATIEAWIREGAEPN